MLNPFIERGMKFTEGVNRLNTIFQEEDPKIISEIEKLMNCDYEPQMAYILNANEKILMEGKANKIVFLGANKGGTLILTNQRLIFKSVLSTKIEAIPITSISRSADSLNALIPSGNMIKVCTTDGKTHQFLVVGKQKEDWKRALTTVANMLRG